MGREPGDPRGAGLPPAGQERCHSLFAAPLGLGGPSGSLRSRRGLCLSASLSHPAQQSCSSVLGPPACHLPRGPGPGGRVWGRDRAAGARRKRQASHRHGKAWALFLVQGTRADGVRPALQKTASVPDAKDAALLRRPRTPGAEGRSFPRASGYAFTPQRASEPLDPRASCRGDRRAVGGKAPVQCAGPCALGARGLCAAQHRREQRLWARWSSGDTWVPASPAIAGGSLPDDSGTACDSAESGNRLTEDAPSPRPRRWRSSRAPWPRAGLGGARRAHRWAAAGLPAPRTQWGGSLGRRLPSALPDPGESLQPPPAQCPAGGGPRRTRPGRLPPPPRGADQRASP